MNVADTEVISRTDNDSVGLQGRMECHCEDGDDGSTSARLAFAFVFRFGFGFGLAFIFGRWSMSWDVRSLGSLSVRVRGDDRDTETRW